MNKKIIIVNVSITLLFIGVAWFVFCFESPSTILTVPNVASSWQHRHVDFETKLVPFKGESLSLIVSGELDGTARFSYGGITETIGPGHVMLKRVSPEWWCEWCDLSYEPNDVRTGSLQFEVNIN
jgi:hypothetical protein